jgi:hypothetical protein
MDELGGIWEKAVVECSGIFLEEASKPTKSCLDKRCPAKIWTEHLPNTSLEHHSYTNVFGVEVGCLTP